MGREVKRVETGFNYPLNKTWEGYLNPHYQFSKNCSFCDRSGYNPETKKISDTWYTYNEVEWVYISDSRRYNNLAWQYHITQDEVQALIDHDRLIDFTHTWSREDGWKKKDPPYIPTAEEVNAWAIQGIGHDSLNRGVCIEARAKRLGVYGLCEHCKGEGTIWRTPEDEVNAEKWEPTDPPSGNWYQVWETTSEGSPISPAFETPEELARWLADNGASSFGGQTETYETWLEFIKGPGWAVSMVAHNGKMESGVKAMRKDT